MGAMMREVDENCLDKDEMRDAAVLEAGAEETTVVVAAAEAAAVTRLRIPNGCMGRAVRSRQDKVGGGGGVAQSDVFYRRGSQDLMMESQWQSTHQPLEVITNPDRGTSRLGWYTGRHAGFAERNK